MTLSDAADLATFARDRALPNVIDFPLQDSLVRYAGGSAGARGIASRLVDDDYFRGSNGVAPTPATFLGNHDMGRAALLIKQQTGASGAELERRVVLGNALLFFLRGAPVVYYGDEVGMIGRGGDKAARQDMFPTKVAEWQSGAAGRRPADRDRLLLRRRHRAEHRRGEHPRVRRRFVPGTRRLQLGPRWCATPVKACSLSAAST